MKPMGFKFAAVIICKQVHFIKIKRFNRKDYKQSSIYNQPQPHWYFNKGYVDTLNMFLNIQSQSLNLIISLDKVEYIP